MKVTLDQLKTGRPRIVGLSIKIKLQGRFRRGKILNIARTKDTKELLVKIRVDQMDMIWSSPFKQIDWHKSILLRNEDRQVIKDAMNYDELAVYSE